MKSGALGAVVLEADFTVSLAQSRRLQLAVEQSRCFGAVLYDGDGQATTVGHHRRADPAGGSCPHPAPASAGASSSSATGAARRAYGRFHGMAQKQRMTRRIVSLWFPKLGIDRLARRMRHDWDKLPVVVIAETGNRVFVTDLNTEAEQAGIAPGMALADARTLSPGLITHPAEARRRRRVPEPARPLVPALHPGGGARAPRRALSRRHRLRPAL